MKHIIGFILMLSCTLSSYANDFAWICADHAEDYSWWCFVYEDIQTPSTNYGYFKIWIKWDYATKSAQAEFDTDARISKQLYEISNDFKEYRILQVIDYDNENKVIGECSIPSKWGYFVPETIGEAIVETAKEILLNK